MNVRVRIAPSPTGYPHIGTIWQALVNFAFAKKNEGKFIVRIEDTDRERLIPGAEEKIFQALTWFGLIPNESPIHGGNYGPYRQSERLADYKKYADQLVKSGYAYYCFCSTERLAELRKKQQKENKVPMYDKACLALHKQQALDMVNSGHPYVIRLKVPANETIIVNDLLRGEIKFNSNIIDDQILLKSDGFPTYHLAVVVDDHLMEISHVTRGEEWLSSAPKHVLLYDYFGWKKPVFVHTPLLRNPDKSKLSKRQGHTNVSWYRQNGYLPEAILNFLSLLGWSHPGEKTIFSLDEFIKLFDLKDLSRVGPIVDLEKLDYINGVYLRNSDDKKLLKAMKLFLKFKIDKPKLLKLIPPIKERITKLTQVNDLVEFFFKIPDPKKELFKRERVKEQLLQSIESIKKIVNWEASKIYPEFKKICDGGKYHKKDFYVNLYVAIEGKQTGLPIFGSMEILGKNEVLLRLEKALNVFSSS